jgi:cell division protein FtsL
MTSQLSLLVRGREFWAGVAVTGVAVLLVVEAVPNLHRSRIASQKMGSYYQMRTDRESVAGGGGGGDNLQVMNYLGAAESPGYDDARKMIRNASMELIVKLPKETSDNIRQMAEQAGGFLVSAEVNGGENASNASLTIRVPLDQFEEVRAKIAKLGVRVQSEKVDAQDVTKQYVDLSARLRNLRAQETQYLGILKQARTVKDTVDVSDKLNEVRSQIEQQQAEFDALSKQVETVALTLSLTAEADVRVFGLQWRPLYHLKSAARDGLDGVGDYASAMASFVFFIPALLLWVLTVALGAAVAWRLLRWAWRTLFAKPVMAS